MGHPGPVLNCRGLPLSPTDAFMLCILVRQGTLFQLACLGPIDPTSQRTLQHLFLSVIYEKVCLSRSRKVFNYYGSLNICQYYSVGLLVITIL